jgi:hypothetical protein
MQSSLALCHRHTPYTRHMHSLFACQSGCLSATYARTHQTVLASASYASDGIVVTLSRRSHSCPGDDMFSRHICSVQTACGPPARGCLAKHHAAAWGTHAATIEVPGHLRIAWTGVSASLMTKKANQRGIATCVTTRVRACDIVQRCTCATPV